MKIEFTEDEIREVNKTCKGGFVGKRCIVIRWIEQNIPSSSNLTFLDYGAGKKALQTMQLREKGYNVTAYEIGKNFNSDIHDINALDKKYDLVYASNVLNVQKDLNMLIKTLEEIKSLEGIFIYNIPKSPLRLPENLIKKQVHEIFKTNHILVS
jgi:16S rRNA A1518/A1519 N6-dimethyltransferase RsmA/KsgA/DIM1 with predicted DNA glycosylase/AP lyase activity